MDEVNSCRITFNSIIELQSSIFNLQFSPTIRFASFQFANVLGQFANISWVTSITFPVISLTSL